jgi:hypothetical protein
MSNEKLSKDVDDNRVSRQMEDRAITENRQFSDDDRLAMFRQQLFQSALPDLPPIPGYHVCWLTTSNPRDSIHSRRSLGYTPVEPHEVPGWDHASLKTGEYSGCIGVNEMVAFKLPMKLYEAYMHEAHYERPRAEEGKLVDTAEFIRNQAKQAGGDIYEGDGLAAMRSPMSR